MIVPARNAETLLPDCIAAIRAQDRPPDELWIVVGPSEDGTLATAHRLADERTTVLVNEAGDRGSGLNLALGLTRAEAVAFVDAQSLIAPDYLGAAVRAMEATGADVVGGPMRPVGRSVIGRSLAVALRSPFGIGDSQFHYEGEARDVESVYLGVYRRSVIERTGPYNTALLRTEDDDMNARIRAAGGRIHLDPRIRSTYLCRNRLTEIWAQYHGYGYWKVALAAIRPDAIRTRHILPALFTLVVTAATIVSALAWWPALPVLVAAYAAIGWVAALVAGAQGLPALAAFPVVTSAMHLGYGVGTISGLVRWRKLRRLVR